MSSPKRHVLISLLFILKGSIMFAIFAMYCQEENFERGGGGGAIPRKFC